MAAAWLRDARALRFAMHQNSERLRKALCGQESSTPWERPSNAWGRFLNNFVELGASLALPMYQVVPQLAVLRWSPPASGEVFVSMNIVTLTWWKTLAPSEALVKCICLTCASWTFLSAVCRACQRRTYLVHSTAATATIGGDQAATTSYQPVSLYGRSC